MQLLARFHHILYPVQRQCFLISDGTVDITSADPPVSGLAVANKLFVVSGDGDPTTRDLQVSGTVNGSVSVVVKGDGTSGDLGTTAITGDLIYSDPIVDALSLTSIGPIEIWQDCNAGTAIGCLPPAPW